MGLRLRFNLILTAVFALGLLVSGAVSYNLLQQNAREEVIHTANLMIQAARAFRSYTVNEIKPLLARQLDETFLPQTVPAYAGPRRSARCPTSTATSSTRRRPSIRPTRAIGRSPGRLIWSRSSSANRTRAC